VESNVDERGRVLIPRGLRSEVGLDEGTVVEIRREGKHAVVLSPSRKERRTWRELNGLDPTRREARMADPEGSQEHLGVDTNVLVAYLDGANPSHKETRWLADRSVILNPTIVHEAYHTLVFKAKWASAEASRALLDACSDPRNMFVNQTLRTTKLGLDLAARHGLGGRDALILASLLGANVRKFFTFDKDLLALKRVSHGKVTLTIRAG
jgi:predicted nucleic acid-binding protein/antitoxin component of MazEF toxin-antitoxin module